ncbi:MAG: response regulator, partial [Spartobacteria bacterium]|nr:response regulator [Spartobacteria bacterium]
MKNRLLFVDDEKCILMLLERMFMPMQDRWELLFAHDGEGAMAIMEEKPVDALISDLNMPGMDGARLMDQVAE